MQTQLPPGAGSEAQFIVKQIKVFVTEGRISQHARVKKILIYLKAEDNTYRKTKETSSPLALDL